MLTLRLPDGSIKQVPEGTRPRTVAEGIGKRLAQAAVAAKVNGLILDGESRQRGLRLPLSTTLTLG